MLLALLLACAAGTDPVFSVTAWSTPAPPRLALPVAQRERLLDRVMGVDHDPAVYDGVEEVNCLAYDGRGFPYCYDQHEGTDFDLAGGFDAMDAGSADVIAPADGVVVAVEDGHYDRCHLDVETWGVDCDGHEIASNHVWIEHDGGWRTFLGHMKQDSIVVAPGDVVAAGDPLGLIGSSGWSTAPHVHLELWTPDGAWVDPFAGEYSQDESYWCDQDAAGPFPGDC